MAASNFPSSHLLKENADPITPPQKKPQPRIHTPSSTPSTPLYSRFLREVDMGAVTLKNRREAGRASPSKQSRPQSPEKQRRGEWSRENMGSEGEGSERLSKHILEIGPNGFYFSCEIPKSKIVEKERGQRETAGSRTGSPVRVYVGGARGGVAASPGVRQTGAQTLMMNISMESEGLQRSNVDSPGKLGDARKEPTPTPVRKGTRTPLDRTPTVTSVKRPNKILDCSPHRILPRERADGHNREDSDGLRYGTGSSTNPTKDYNGHTGEPHSVPNNAYFKPGVSHRPLSTTGSAVNTAMNTRKPTVQTPANASPNPHLDHEKRPTSVKKVAFTPQRRGLPNAKKYKRSAGTPHILRVAMEEEMALFRQSMRQLSIQQTSGRENTKAALLSKSAPPCPGSAETSQDSKRRSVRQEKERNGVPKESSSVGRPPQATPSKPETTGQESYTPEGLPPPKMPWSSSSPSSSPSLETTDPPPTLKLPVPIKPSFFKTPVVRKTALPLVSYKGPLTTGRARPIYGTSSGHGTRTPSREIQSALDRAIDAKIDEYKLAGSEFTPSGNRVSDLLEARERNSGGGVRV